MRRCSRFEVDRGEWRAHLQGDHGDGSGRDPGRAIQRDGDDRQGDLPTLGSQHRGGGKDGCEGSGERGRVRSLFKVARQVLQEDLGENHADPQGVYVPESGKGCEVAHHGHFPVGGQMECHAQGDERPERAETLEGSVPE